MKMIKKIEFTRQEEEALNTVIKIWKNFYEECDGEECEDCEECIFRGFCDSPLSVIYSDYLNKIKENMEARIGNRA